MRSGWWVNARLAHPRMYVHERVPNLRDHHCAKCDAMARMNVGETKKLKAFLERHQHGAIPARCPWD